MLYVECYADFALVRCLGVSKREITHAFGKSRVCKRLKKTSNSKGLIDEDPSKHQPPYLKKFQIREDLSLFKIRILFDSTRNNSVIVLCPRLEEWVLNAAKEANLDMAKYRLPNDPEKLHEILSSASRSENNEIKKFQKLVQDLKEKSPMMNCLKKLLTELP